MSQPPYPQQPPQYLPQYQQPRQPPPSPSRRRTRASVIAGIAVIAAGVAAAVIAVAVHHGSQQPASTVTFAVTGDPARVTYGDTGSSAQGSVPMSVTIPLGNPLYYSINAQLDGDGQVTCQILVGDAVISQATATGGYSIASCQASRDPASGQWRDDNAA